MIRIVNEAKADFERFARLCADLLIKKLKIDVQYSGDELESKVQKSIEIYEKQIDAFNAKKHAFSPPLNDITYWYKKVQNEGYDGVKSFEQFVSFMDAEISARKEIKNLYPANLLRQFEKM